MNLLLVETFLIVLHIGIKTIFRSILCFEIMLFLQNVEDR